MRELAGPDPRDRPADPRGVRGDVRGRRAATSRRSRRSCSPAAAAGCGSCARTPARVRCSAAPTSRRTARIEDRSTPRPRQRRRAEDDVGVEIEITPAGKATKRLTLLSGGEKSMTALAFLFAVFLARPCPFYILDEVEAALDDLNIDRFLTLLRRFSDRAQFIVVTHQKRTMEAADCLYGVSMAGNGVSKVISRRLPPRPAGGGRGLTEDRAEVVGGGARHAALVARLREEAPRRDRVLDAFAAVPRHLFLPGVELERRLRATTPSSRTTRAASRPARRASRA